jgi:hypothetical protein
VLATSPRGASHRTPVILIHGLAFFVASCLIVLKKAFLVVLSIAFATGILAFALLLAFLGAVFAHLAIVGFLLLDALLIALVLPIVLVLVLPLAVPVPEQARLLQARSQPVPRLE